MAEKKEKTAKKAPAAKARRPRRRPRPRRAAKKAAAKAPATAPAKGEKVDRSLIEVKDPENQKVTEIRLHPEVFGVRVNDHLLYEAVKQYRAGGRRGTHMTKNRALVSGTGQEALEAEGHRPRPRRLGPQPRSGATAAPCSAPCPATTRTPCPRRPGRPPCAPRSASASTRAPSRWSTGFPLDVPKTKVLKGLLAKLGIAGKTILVDHEPTDALVLSGRNIPGLHVVADTHLTVYDVLDCRNLVVSQAALDKLEERLTP